MLKHPTKVADMGLFTLLRELRQARDETIVRTHVTTAADMLLKDRGCSKMDVHAARKQLADLLEGHEPQPEATATQLFQDPLVARLAEHHWALHAPLSTITVRHRTNHFLARLQDLNEAFVLSDEWLQALPAPSLHVRQAANLMAVYNRLYPHERETFLDLVAIARHSQRPQLSARTGFGA